MSRLKEEEVKKMRKLKKRFEFDTLNTIEAFACLCGCGCAQCSCGCIPHNPTDSADDRLGDSSGESVYNAKDDNKISLL